MDTAPHDLQRELENALDGEVRFDKISRALYSTDASVYQIIPAGVVIPKTRDDVIKVVELCRKHRVSITARGGGTSQAGQAIGAGIQLDFSKYMNRLIELNPDSLTVTVEPGIVLDELNAVLKPYGLHLPLDLSTSNRATIGGMIANNSAGTRSVVYGKTLDYVMEMTVVMSDGSVVEMRPAETNELEVIRGQDNLEANGYRIVTELVTKHRNEIAARYPKILRRVGGYNLDEFVTAPASNSGVPTPRLRPARDDRFNLCRLMVGSEGTLGLVVAAKLRLVPLQKARIVCVVQFHDLLEALAATPVILAHNPSAVELVDRFILSTTKGKTEFEPLRDFIVGDPAAVLIVEFFGESEDELPRRIDQLESDLQRKKLGDHIYRAVGPSDQDRIWKLRRAALGLSMSQRGDAKAISFVEDSAVAPENLRDYIERFIAILDENQLQAGFYAHASVGLLHIRPVVDMKTADGIGQFERVANQISDLVLEFGGAVSGEHGDGLVRTPFQEKIFGSTLYAAFREIKRTFDADEIFNPGKIIDAPALTDNLRFGSEYETRVIDTTFDFDDFGGISRAAEQCGGVGACRKSLTGTMCPSYMATRDEADSTRGRANALRLAISGQLGPDGLEDADLYPILDLCLECKACKSECPTGVDMARMKSEFLHRYHARHGRSIRSRILGHARRTAVWGSRSAPFSNWILQSRIARWFNQRSFGLDQRRLPPEFARQTFQNWWRQRTNNPRKSADHDSIVLFADTFSNFFEPEQAIAVVQFAEKLGLQVEVPKPVCCGRPLISKGFLDEAVRQAESTTNALHPNVKKGRPIVFCEPSCYSAVRDDHPHLLRGEMKTKSEFVAAACVTFEEWATNMLADSAIAIPMTGHGQRVLYHGHCHQKALVGSGAASSLFSSIPDLAFREIDSGCCGMAGSFGYEREHYEVSRSIGEQRLFPAIRDAEKQTTIVAPGFSCRHQIKHFTGVDAVSPATMIQTLFECE